MGFLFFAGLSLKFYAVIPLSVLIVSYCLTLLRKRLWKHVTLIVLLCAVGGLASYFLFYKGSGSSAAGLIWQPLSLAHQIIEDQNLWHNKDMVDQRYFLIQSGKWFSPRLWWIETKTILLFLFFNYGLRFVAILFLPFLLITVKEVRAFIKEFTVLFAIVVLSTLISLLFIQKGTWWNTIQFLYYVLS